MNIPRMTFKQINEKYGFKEPTFKDGKLTLNPVYKKWLTATHIIEDIYGLVESGNISLGKARELTSAVINEVMEEYNKLRFEEAIKEIEERRDSTHPENRYFMVIEILKSKL